MKTDSYYKIINEGKGLEWHFEPATVSDLKGEIEAIDEMLKVFVEAIEFWKSRKEPWKMANQLMKLQALNEERARLMKELEKAIADWKASEAVER